MFDQKTAQERNVRDTTEHLIQQSPINTGLIAADTGPLAALSIFWFVRSRQQ